MTLAMTEWVDEAAWQVFADLDMDDRIEAALWRGDRADPMALWADWRLLRADARALLRIVHWHGRPIAVLGLQPTGFFGVMQAALVACDHRRNRRGLVALARLLRAQMPDRAAEWGVNRIECRSWSGHPTAARLLAAIGFVKEAELAGMPAPFAQYAWTLEHGENPCA